MYEDTWKNNFLRMEKKKSVRTPLQGPHSLHPMFKQTLLKPRVRDMRLYGTVTSGLMLIPVTHPTQCVLNAQNAGSAGKRTRLWVHRPNT